MVGSVGISGTERELNALYRRLPHGPHGMGRDAVARHQRARLFGAMIEAVHRQGYKATTVAHVIALAGVSRRAFYEQFANKEDCFLAAYDAGVDGLLAAIDGALDALALDWRAGSRRAVEVYLAAMAASPAFARAFLIEALGAGPEALARRDVVQERFAAQLAAIHRRSRADIPEIPAVGPHTFRAAVGAVNELVTAHVLERGADTLPELTDAILDVHLALLVGRELAARIATVAP